MDPRAIDAMMQTGSMGGSELAIAAQGKDLKSK
jgi:hypothetical protein